MDYHFVTQVRRVTYLFWLLLHFMWMLIWDVMDYCWFKPSIYFKVFTDYSKDKCYHTWLHSNLLLLAGSIWIICKSSTCIFAWQSTRLVSGLTRFLTAKLWVQFSDLFWWLDDWCLACTASQYFLWLICQWRIWTIIFHYGRRCNVTCKPYQ